MSTKKLKLSEIKIQSFITTLDEKNEHQKGMSFSCGWTNGGFGASVTSECCEYETRSFCTEATCSPVYCVTNDGHCPTDPREDTCSAPGENGC